MIDLKKKDPILVIDDDADFLDMISDMLGEEGYQVETAQTGAEALRKIQEEYYDLLLIDIKLPDIDGTQLLKRIEDTEPEIRRVVITGYPSIESAQQALNLKAHAYLIKPVKAEVLRKTVEQQLKERDKEFKDKYLTLKKI